MTAPSSADTRPRVDQLRDELRRRKLSEPDIETALQRAGYIQAPQPGFGQQLLHGAGLAARGVVQGLGGLADLNPYTAPQRISNHMAGIPTVPTGQAANEIGLPQPSTPGERVAVSAVEGAATSLPFVATGGVGALAGPALGAASNAAGQVAKEAGVAPLGQMAASLAVGAGIPIVGSLGAGIIRAALRGTATRQQAAEEALALLQAGRPKAPVTLGQVASGGMGRTIEAQLRNTPATQARFRRVLDAQDAALKGRAEGIADRLARTPAEIEEAAGAPGSVPSVEMAGAVVQRGIEKGFVPRFRSMADLLYNKVWAMVPADTPVKPARTVSVFAQQGALAAKARPFSDNLAHPVLSRWSNDLAETLTANPRGIPLDVLKGFRSRLGAMLDGSDLVEGVNLGDVRKLYGATSDDLAAAIQKTNPRALPAWERAQNFWKAGQDRLERVLQPLVDKRTAELAYQSMIGGTKEGATALRATMRSLLPEERRIVASAVLRRMGRATASNQNDLGDVFSAERFLTNWNQFSPEARSALFAGIDPTATRDLNSLAKALSYHRQMDKMLRRPGGAASSTALMDILRGLGWAAAGGASGRPLLAAAGMAPLAGTVGADLAARAFTSPKVVRWLVRQTKVPAGALAQELVLLSRQAKDWAPADRDLADEVVKTLGGVDWPRARIEGVVADSAPTYPTR